MKRIIMMRDAPSVVKDFLNLWQSFLLFSSLP